MKCLPKNLRNITSAKNEQNEKKKKHKRERKISKNGALGAQDICLFAVSYISDSVRTCPAVFLNEKTSQKQNFTKLVRTG